MINIRPKMLYTRKIITVVINVEIVIDDCCDVSSSHVVCIIIPLHNMSEITITREIL